MEENEVIYKEMDDFTKKRGRSSISTDAFRVAIITEMRRMKILSKQSHYL